MNGDPRQLDRSLLQRLEGHVWRRMFAGLFVLIPLLVTVVIVWLAIDRLDGFVPSFVTDRVDFTGIGLVSALVLLYVIGWLAATRLGDHVVGWEKAVLGRVPVVKHIYGVARQAADALSVPMGHHFSRVVFIEWPRSGMRAMGFVTGHYHSGPDNETLVAIYVPTVPNPTSGNLAFVREDDVIETAISVEDAMKVVFSGGIVLPGVVEGSPRTNIPKLPQG